MPKRKPIIKPVKKSKAVKVVKPIKNPTIQPEQPLTNKISGFTKSPWRKK